jgi:hypothetical protein
VGERDVITCPQIGPSVSNWSCSVEIGLDLKLVRLWKTLGMAKLPQGENWSFQGHSEANLCVLEPRVFPPKLVKYGQGFPNLENDSHPTFKLVVSPSLFTFTFTLPQTPTQYNMA